MLTDAEQTGINLTLGIDVNAAADAMQQRCRELIDEVRRYGADNERLRAAEDKLKAAHRQVGDEVLQLKARLQTEAENTAKLARVLKQDPAVPLLEWAGRVAVDRANLTEWQETYRRQSTELEELRRKAEGLPSTHYSGGVIVDGRKVEVTDGDVLVLRPDGLLTQAACQKLDEVTAALGVHVLLLETVDRDPNDLDLGAKFPPELLVLRPLREENSCDWGHCNEMAVAERWDRTRAAWLPVCTHHTIRDDDPVGPKKVPWHVCPICGSKSITPKPKPPFFNEECVSNEHEWHYGPGGEIHAGRALTDDGRKNLGLAKHVCCVKPTVLAQVTEEE